MRKTLVVRACAVGDFVLNLPAIQALHKLRPDARFTFVGYPSTLDLASDFVPVDAVHSIETQPWSRLFYETVSDKTFLTDQKSSEAVALEIYKTCFEK